MQKPESSTTSSVVTKGLEKAKRDDSARAALLLLKKNLRSSVQTKARLVEAEAERRWRSWRNLA